ncbi:peptide deformylase [Corynebacterium lactis]|uniref:Peptide deformylase n=1 Tax=Corynebacterium lactis RW2-5 TaxID=1408189 RepID=A0A0K2H007_9CORY|nr:peptide deformylase [Corynebacterium lactis]ALA67364.1 peptide deformylase [Corynebacterium lactis RW2-5]
MAIREVRVFGDPVLLSKADTVTDFDGTLSHLIDDMFDTMDDEQGVGLAANQVGVLQRVFVYDCEGTRGHIVNPQWEAIGEETVHETEGCLSIPGVNGAVTRFAKVRVTGQDRTGTPVSFEADGLLSRCVQHESDHLDGVLFLKRLTGDERKTAMRSLREQDWFKNRG